MDKFLGHCFSYLSWRRGRGWPGKEGVYAFYNLIESAEELTHAFVNAVGIFLRFST